MNESDRYRCLDCSWSTGAGRGSNAAMRLAVDHHVDTGHTVERDGSAGCEGGDDDERDRASESEENGRDRERSRRSTGSTN